MIERYMSSALVDFATHLFERSGLAPERARVFAEVLVEADLMGHDTHGLNLLAAYLGSLDGGTMTKSGEPRVISDRGAVALWDGGRLPGPWLVVRAIDHAIPRAREFGTCTIVLRRSHHIACLAAYLRRATEAGLAIQILSSDPDTASVAPFGGTRPVFTPNPLAFGAPTSGDPILVDISASITTNGMSARLAKEGRRFDHPWLLTADGLPTDDPSVFTRQPPGTILPLGGLDAGHKGYGLALMIEALTGGLAGVGRDDPRPGWGATVHLQLTDPSAFGGMVDFHRQLDWIVDACRSSPPRAGVEAVRLPGQRALARRREQLRDGVALHPAILPQLAPWATKLGVPMPAALPA